MRWRPLVMGTCVVLLATSCLRLEQTIKVDSNGDMRHDTVFDIDIDTALPILTSEYGPGLPDDPQKFLCDNVARAGESAYSTSDADVDWFTDADRCGVRVSEDFDGRADMSVPLSYVLNTGSGGSTLVKNGTVWEFETTLNTSALQEFPIAEDPTVVQRLREQATVVFRLELPGEAIAGRHNADEVDGGTFVWKIDPDDDPFGRLFAAVEATPPSSGAPLGVLIGGGAAVALGIGAIAWMAMRRRTGKRAAVTSAASATAAANPSEPVFDSELGVWTAEDPVRGPVWFHEGANEWIPR